MAWDTASAEEKHETNLATKKTDDNLPADRAVLARVRGSLANVSLGKQFEDYAVSRLNQTIDKTVDQVTELYARSGNRWNVSSLDEPAWRCSSMG